MDKKNMQKLYAPIAALLAAALIIAGCSSPLNPPEQDSGKGTVGLSLNSEALRTLIPDANASISYRVNASKQGQTAEIDGNWNGSGTKQIDLEPGTWDITVTGFIRENQGAVDISQGSKSVSLSAGQNAGTVNINLSRIGASEGTGTFSYSFGASGADISYPAGTAFYEALLFLEPVGGGPATERDLKTQSSGAISLASGYYWLTVKLVKADGSEAGKSEIVHIYKDRETKAAESQVFRFTAGDFAQPDRSPPDPKSRDSILGWGYDIAGFYAEAASIRWKVLDYKKLDTYGKIAEMQVMPANFRVESGSTVTEYQKSLVSSINAGLDLNYLGLAAFSAEVGQRFSSTASASSAYAFSTIRAVFPKAQYRVDEAVRTLAADYLHRDFKRELETLSPRQLIDQYGTHVMLGGVWGGRADYNMSAGTYQSVSTEDVSNYVKIKAKAKYKGLTIGVDLNAASQQTVMSKFASESTNINALVWGGSSLGALEIANEAAYNTWVASLGDPSNWTWYDFCPGNYLVQITEFITDPAKKAAVQAALNAYYAEKKINCATGPYIQKPEQSGTYTMSPFRAQGGAAKTGGSGDGDADIYTTNGFWPVPPGNTNWSLNLAFKPGADKRSIDMTYTYVVQEAKGDWTKLQIYGTKNFPVSNLPQGAAVTRVNSGAGLNYNGTIKGKTHDWNTVHQSGSTKVQVKIDDSGDDYNNIGFYLEGFAIPYEYQ